MPTKRGASGRYRGPSLTTSDGPSFLPAYCRQHRNGHPHRGVASTPLNPEQHSNPDEGQRPARPSQPPVSPGGAWPTRGSRGAEKFNSDVPGLIFWPIMLVMLGVLIPIVLSIR